MGSNHNNQMLQEALRAYEKKDTNTNTTVFSGQNTRTLLQNVPFQALQHRIQVQKITQKYRTSPSVHFWIRPFWSNPTARCTDTEVTRKDPTFLARRSALKNDANTNTAVLSCRTLGRFSRTCHFQALQHRILVQNKDKNTGRLRIGCIQTMCCNCPFRIDSGNTVRLADDTLVIAMNVFYKPTVRSPQPRISITLHSFLRYA